MLVTANLEALFKTEERRRSDRTATGNIDEDNVEEEDNEPLQEENSLSVSHKIQINYYN